MTDETTITEAEYQEQLSALKAKREASIVTELVTDLYTYFKDMDKDSILTQLGKIIAKDTELPKRIRNAWEKVVEEENPQEEKEEDEDIIETDSEITENETKTDETIEEQTDEAINTIE